MMRPEKETVSKEELQYALTEIDGWGGNVVLCRRLMRDRDDIVYDKMTALEATYLLYFDERNGVDFCGGWIVYNSRLDGRGIPVKDMWGGSA